MMEAILAAEEGVPLVLIDRAATDFGMPMGPKVGSTGLRWR
jgi:3-hydroxyacyl-CoA dehydrogenase